MICGPPNQGSCWPCGGQAHEPIAFPSFCNEMQQSFNNLRLASLCHSPQVHFQMFSTRLYCVMHYNSECSSLRLKHKTICTFKLFIFSYSAMNILSFMLIPQQKIGSFGITYDIGRLFILIIAGIHDIPAQKLRRYLG